MQLELQTKQIIPFLAMITTKWPHPATSLQHAHHKHNDGCINVRLNATHHLLVGRQELAAQRHGPWEADGGWRWMRRRRRRALMIMMPMTTMIFCRGWVDCTYSPTYPPPPLACTHWMYKTLDTGCTKQANVLHLNLFHIDIFVPTKVCCFFCFFFKMGEKGSCRICCLQEGVWGVCVGWRAS